MVWVGGLKIKRRVKARLDKCALPRPTVLTIEDRD